jgi:hypothetical protein
MTMESGLPFTLFYILNRWSVSSTSHKIFMNFVEILKLLQIFEVLVK